MAQTHNIVTPTAFIMGQVTVSGLRGRGYAPAVRIIAKANGHVTETTAKSEATYVLLVSPGEWTVAAEVGGVVSEPTNITLDAEQTVEVNFIFGRLT